MTAEQDAIGALAAADPADNDDGGDLAALRHAVDARIGEPILTAGSELDAQAVVAGSITEPQASDELAARRDRRRRPWIIGTAAASALLVGLAGYAIGTARAGGQPQLSETGSADSAIEPAGPIDGFAGGSSGMSSGAAAAETGATFQSAGSSRATYTAAGLSTAAGTAHGYSFDSGIDLEAATTQIAQALGVDGAATELEGYWSATGSDGSQVQVFADANASASYYNPNTPMMACTVTDVAAEGGVDSSQPSCSVEGGDPTADVDLAATEQVATAFLTSIGVDSAEFTVETVVEGNFASVNYSWTDAPTVVAWNVSVLDGDIVGLWGSLAPRVDLGEYPIVSPTEAVDRLGDARFDGMDLVMPMVTEPATGGPQVMTDPPAPIAPGDPIPWSVANYTITSATLGLSQYWLDNGSVALLPTWNLTDDAAGASWQVIALAEDSLAF